MTDGFTKRSSAGPGYFPVEAAGLRWLDSAHGTRVVQVLDVSDAGIILEQLGPVPPTTAAAVDLGRSLARTHAAGAGSLGQPPDGWTEDGYIGRQALTLRPSPTWGAFYAEQRLLPYARAARDLQHLSAAGLTAVERVCDRLAAGDFDDGRPPARIHGDLWSGNVLFTADGVVLIDPAAHGGHGLTDVAMLHLFGAPHLKQITAAYAEAAQLDRGWQSLIRLHQLHPLLVHAISHGPTYGAEAADAAQQYF